VELSVLRCSYIGGHYVSETKVTHCDLLSTDWDVYLRTFLKTPAVNKMILKWLFLEFRGKFFLVTKSHVMRFRISVNKSPHFRFFGTRCGLVTRFSVRLLYFLANNLPSESGLAAETHRTGLRVNELLNHGSALGSFNGSAPCQIRCELSMLVTV